MLDRAGVVQLCVGGGMVYDVLCVQCSALHFEHL